MIYWLYDQITMQKLILLGLFLTYSEIQNVLGFWEGMEPQPFSTPAPIPMVSFPSWLCNLIKIFHIESEMFLSNSVAMSIEFDGEWWKTYNEEFGECLPTLEGLWEFDGEWWKTYYGEFREYIPI